MASPDWGTRVVTAVLGYSTDGKWLLEPVRLINVSLEIDPDGTPVLKVIYESPSHSKRIGLRRRLDRIPFGAHGGESPEESLAREICIYEISEPLGRYSELLVEDANGVWWWGDGYPTLSENRLSEP